MDIKNDISEDLNRRIDQLTARSTLTPERIIEDSLAHGRSLAWQEKWLEGIQQGIVDAERGDFATDEEIAVVLNKYSST